MRMLKVRERSYVESNLESAFRARVRNPAPILTLLGFRNAEARIFDELELG